MLPKIRSKKLKDACADMPCTLRIASIFGGSCSPQNTVVGAHLPLSGRGWNTKGSEINIAAACFTCHDLIDGRRITRDEPDQQILLWQRIAEAHAETLARWIGMDLVVVPGAKVIGK